MLSYSAMVVRRLSFGCIQHVLDYVVLLFIRQWPFDTSVITNVCWSLSFIRIFMTAFLNHVHNCGKHLVARACPRHQYERNGSRQSLAPADSPRQGRRYRCNSEGVILRNSPPIAASRDHFMVLLRYPELFATCKSAQSDEPWHCCCC